MKKYLMNFIAILGVGILTLWFIGGGKNFSQMINCLKALTPIWVGAGVVCIGLYWGFETLIQNLLVRRTCRGNSLWNSFKVVMTGHFFNAITPFASGGQPMQAMIMVQQGVPLGTSASVLLSKFIVYQLILTVYSFVVLLLKLRFFTKNINGLVYLALVGFGLNLVVVIVLIGIAFMKERVKRVSFSLVNLLHRLHIIKHPATYKKKIVKQVDVFSRNIDEIKKNTGLLLQVAVLTVLQLTCYFLIPFAVYRAFGYSGTFAQVFLMVAAAAFIVMISSFVPIPGGSGVAEGSFFLLFSLFFPKSILPAAVLCWRIITFYLPLCCGGLMTILPNDKVRGEKDNIAV